MSAQLIYSLQLQEQIILKSINVLLYVDLTLCQPKYMLTQLYVGPTGLQFTKKNLKSLNLLLYVDLPLCRPNPTGLQGLQYIFSL